MLIYPGHLHILIDYGRSLLIFLLSVAFWLNEMGRIWSRRAFRRERLKFCMLMYPDHLQNLLD